MPLKIRCPHCRKVLLADAQYAGQDKACPKCGKVFNIPVPISDRNIADSAPSASVVSPCPHCGYDVAPGTSFCKKCMRGLADGKRIPLSHRLQLVSVRNWTLAALIVVAVPFLGVVGYTIYRDRFARADEPLTPFVPVTPREVASSKWAQQLFQAASRQERADAVNQLNQMGPRAVTDLLAALEASVRTTGADRRQQRRNQTAAIRFLGAFGGGQCKLSLAETNWPVQLHEEVVLARGLLGDHDVLDDLCQLWLDHTRASTFLDEAIRAAGAESASVSVHALRRAHERSRRIERALRGFKRAAFERIAAGYWESWAWLGQSRDDIFAAKLFEMAKPPEDRDMDVSEAVDDLRAARDTLETVTREGPDAVKPVAAVLLANLAPQYRTALNRMKATLARALRDADPVNQQRLTWALASITARQFGAITGDDSPALVRHADVVAALKWIRESRIAQPEPLQTHEGSYLGPPTTMRRVVTVKRQAERDLLARISIDWQTARNVADEWLDLEIGCTPRVRALLNPSQRSPNYPALMGAMIIVAESNATSWREPFTIWRQAGDQPAWVRSLAYTVLAALDAQRGDPIGSWPAELILPKPDAGPGRGDFARVIAAGGAALVERLALNRPLSLSPAAHAELVVAARQALERKPAP